jgi:hypothetical protein
VRRALALLLSSVLVVVVAGCGEGGVSSGATVSAYVAEPLCADAQQELAREGWRAGSVHVRVVCLPSVGWGVGLSLAAVGADVRRATEDSTAVGYIGASQQAPIRFSRPILESAGIASIYRRSGAVAMAKLLKAIRQADNSGSLRASVHADLRG